jgi:hypothetical protein
LEELHDHERATADHTTLLLNCYAKLKDTSKLDSFIKAPGELKFDLETAISMCRQGGYFDQAAYLARKHGDNDMVVDILIEDSQKYAEAVQYIRKLDVEVVSIESILYRIIWKANTFEAYPNMMKYARVLLGHCPSEITKMFIDYYTGQYRPKTDVEPSIQPQPQAGNAVQNFAALLPLPYMNVGTGTRSQPSEAQITTEVENLDGSPAYEIPKPRTAFSSFVDHPEEFIMFLESLIKKDNLKEEDKVDLYTTLFEMYLDKANRTRDSSDKQEWEDKAKKLIWGKHVRTCLILGFQPSLTKQTAPYLDF